MKAVLFNDHRFKVCNNKYYSSTFEKGVLLRYMVNPISTITIVARCEDVDTAGNLKPIDMNGIDFVRVPNFKSLRKAHLFFSAKRIIKREVKDADYIFARTSSIGNMAAKYARKYKKPYLVEVVGCVWDSLWNYSILGKIIAPFSFLTQRAVVKHAPYVFYVTNQFLQRRYPAKGKSTNCSDVALKEFDDAILSRRLEKIAHVTTERIILGTAAAVDVKYKGQQYVIEALGRLKKQGITRFEYHIVGGGDPSYLKSVAEKNDVADQVVFFGSLPHDEVFDWLDTIDIYVQPSKQEGLPRAQIEAMSRGVPSFGSKAGGIPELLDREFIFNTVKEICDILLSLDTDTMIEQAKRNFSESKKYDKASIERHRQLFFKDFYQSAHQLRNATDSLSPVETA